MAWAAENDLIVVTQDRTTMTAHARARLAVGEPMPGLIVVKGRTPAAQVVEDIQLLIEVGPSGWDNPVMFVPIR